MTNSIRTPKQGMTANSRRIAQAVDDEDWQAFRISLKGKPTREKIDELHLWFDRNGEAHTHTVEELPGGTLTDRTDCNICIQVDNYIKALCRGGQLRRGANLLDFINGTLVVLK